MNACAQEPTLCEAEWLKCIAATTRAFDEMSFNLPDDPPWHDMMAMLQSLVATQWQNTASEVVRAASAESLAIQLTSLEETQSQIVRQMSKFAHKLDRMDASAWGFKAEVDKMRFITSALDKRFKKLFVLAEAAELHAGSVSQPAPTQAPTSRISGAAASEPPRRRAATGPLDADRGVGRPASRCGYRSGSGAGRAQTRRRLEFG